MIEKKGVNDMQNFVWIMLVFLFSCLAAYTSSFSEWSMITTLSVVLALVCAAAMVLGLRGD